MMHGLMQVAMVPLEGGWLSWINQKSGEGVTTIQSVALLAAVGFVVFIGIKSKGALAAIVGAGLAAAIFLWLVNNMTAVKTRTDSEMQDAVIAPFSYSAPWVPGQR